MYGFLYISVFLRVPFAWGTANPWDVINPAAYKAAWVSLGLRSTSVVFSLLIIELLARSVDKQSDQTAVGTSQSVMNRVLHSRYLTASLFIILLVPNVAYGFFSVLNRYQARSRPNIIWIMCDSLRADHLGCYGYGRNTSPNIDRLASASNLYSRAVSQASLTRLSVPSFLSGIYPQSNSDRISIAQVLADRGYCTSAIMGNAQFTVPGLPNTVLYTFEHRDSSSSLKPISSPLILSAAMKELEQKRDKPIFMFLLFMDTHAPYRRHAGYEFWDKRDSGHPSVITPDDLLPTTKKKYTEDYLGYLRSLYDSGIGYTDAHIGRLFDELKKLGMYDNSLIIFVGDHGEEFGEHKMFFHGNNLYDHAINVPLIVKEPGQNRSHRIGGVFPLIDLYPIDLGIGWDPSKQ